MMLSAEILCCGTGGSPLLLCSMEGSCKCLKAIENGNCGLRQRAPIAIEGISLNTHKFKIEKILQNWCFIMVKLCEMNKLVEFCVKSI